MRIAAVSAILAPACRNSQKGIKKLLEAVAADEEGLQHRDVTILGSQANGHCARPHAYTSSVGNYLQRIKGYTMEG